MSLPTAWTIAPLEHIADSALGKMLDRAKRIQGRSLPYLRNINVRWASFNLEDLLEMPFEDHELERYGLHPGDVLICEGGEPGRAAVWRGSQLPIKFQKAIHRVRPSLALESQWLVHQLRHDALNGDLEEHFSGTTIKHFTGVALASYPVRLPPVPEQRRIVSKLEALTAKSRRAKEALDAIPPLLERFRQSVLASAFRGDLTAAWRAKNPDVEPADKLLARIRIERRRRWEEAELARMQAKGKTPGDDRWKEKYEEPQPIDTEGLPELPEGWTWVRLPECGEVSRGRSRHRPRNDPALFGGDYPFIQTGEVAQCGGRLRSYTQTYNDVGLAQSRLFPAGTMCITIAANIANSCVLEIDACFPDSVVGVNVDHRMMSPGYLELYLRLARTDIAAFAPGTAQKNINLDILGDLAVPVPPVEERQIMERLIQRAFQRADNLEKLALESHAQAAVLDRSILAKAFRGELVPQDPSDEPASVLLERIRKEREAAGPTGGRGRKKAAPDKAPAKEKRAGAGSPR